MDNRPLDPAHIDHLASLLANDQLVLFVGAGISLQATPIGDSRERLPLWSSLATKVANECSYELADFGNNLLDLFDAIDANRGRNVLEEAVRHAIPDAWFAPGATHAELARLRWHTIVTTNYDDLLQRAVAERAPIVTEENYDWLARAASSRPKLVHLHGTLLNPHTLTGVDFMRWEERHPRAYSFMENISLNKTLLFVGYSFSDPYLKFGLLPWIKKVTAGRNKRHYAWMFQANPAQIRVLDTRDQIEAVSIPSDQDWPAAFRQLHDAVAAKTRKAAKRKLHAMPPPTTNTTDAIVNGYKLYFYRTQAQVSPSWLGQRTGLDPRAINNLEQVKTKVNAGPNCFKTLDREGLAKIEHALHCVGKLEYGGGDDFLAKYIMYYKVNRTVGRNRNATKAIEFFPDTKAVVFDFGGTLTRTTSHLSTWERMWESVGYTIQEAGHYHRRFLSKSLTHQQWCDVTAMKLRERGFSKSHLQKLTETIQPIAGLGEALRALHEQGTALYIVSGSIKQIIIDLLGPLYHLFSEVKANAVSFDAAGIIKSIRGHKYDFEGKGRFIRGVKEELGCPAIDILFVGNSLNDSWASESGARTLCVNPANVEYWNTAVWTEYIREMNNLSEILPFAKRSTVS